MGLTTIAGLLGVGFLFKAFIFMIVIWRIKDATWLDGTVAFFTIVVAVIGSSLVEAITVVKGRVPMSIRRRDRRLYADSCFR